MNKEKDIEKMLLEEPICKCNKKNICCNCGKKAYTIVAMQKICPAPYHRLCKECADTQIGKSGVQKVCDIKELRKGGKK